MTAPARRRGVRSAVGAAIAVAAAVAAGVAILRGPRAEGPDIVLVVWDTTRVDRLSTFGHDRPTSPHLDVLAAGGVRFPRCIAPAPWTPPSHGSLFTGLLPSRHGLTRAPGQMIRRDVPMLAETLSAAGYETACFTANVHVSVLTGLSRGFRDHVACYDPEGVEKGSDRVVAAVDRWLAARPARDPSRRPPAFIFVNLMDAHLPLRPRPDDIAAVRDPAVSDAAIAAAGAITEREAMAHLLGIRRVDEDTLAGLRTLYDAAIRMMDERTAEILSRLRAAGAIGHDALVIVTSDHGENLGDRGQMEHRLSLYDSLLRVPLVVVRPGSFEGGRSDARQVALQDVYATVLREARVPVPRGAGDHALPLPRGGDGRPGRALVAEHQRPEAFIENARRSFPDRPPAFFEPLRVSIEAARDGESAPRQRKYLRFLLADPSGVERTAREELYDLVADPGETRNLLGARRTDEEEAHAARLRALLDAR